MYAARRTILKLAPLAVATGAAIVAMPSSSSMLKSDDERARDDVFDSWGAQLARRGDVLDEVDVFARVHKQGTGRGDSIIASKSLIWHTLQGDGKIERFRMWRCEPDERQRACEEKSDVFPGQSRSLSLVQLGNKVCGHEAYIHGGMTAALLDDLFGWQTGLERVHLAKRDPQRYNRAKAFTARLVVNYRRPLPKNDVFLVECKVARVEKRKKVWLESKVYDRAGTVLIDSEALYIVVPGRGE